jgi:hypothetical protein
VASGAAGETLSRAEEHKTPVAAPRIRGLGRRTRAQIGLDAVTLTVLL